MFCKLLLAFLFLFFLIKKPKSIKNAKINNNNAIARNNRGFVLFVSEIVGVVGVVGDEEGIEEGIEESGPCVDVGTIIIVVLEDNGIDDVSVGNSDVSVPVGNSDVSKDIIVLVGGNDVSVGGNDVSVGNDVSLVGNGISVSNVPVSPILVVIGGGVVVVVI